MRNKKILIRAVQVEDKLSVDGVTTYKNENSHKYVANDWSDANHICDMIASFTPENIKLEVSMKLIFEEEGVSDEV